MFEKRLSYSCGKDTRITVVVFVRKAVNEEANICQYNLKCMRGDLYVTLNKKLRINVSKIHCTNLCRVHFFGDIPGFNCLHKLGKHGTEK